MTRRAPREPARRIGPRRPVTDSTPGPTGGDTTSNDTTLNDTTLNDLTSNDTRREVARR